MKRKIQKMEEAAGGLKNENDDMKRKIQERENGIILLKEEKGTKEPGTI